MISITLPQPRTGRYGGLSFTDGTAEVASLSTHQAEYFAAIGAFVTQVGTRLEDMTAAELRQEADAAGIDVPSHAKKADILALINGADLPVIGDAVEEPEA